MATLHTEQGKMSAAVVDATSRRIFKIVPYWLLTLYLSMRNYDVVIKRSSIANTKSETRGSN